MKSSFYNSFVDYDGNTTILYNTRSRKYLVLSKKEAIDHSRLLSNLNKNEYTQEEADDILKLTKLEMVVSNETDELMLIKNRETLMRTQTQVYNAVVKSTLDCNFRCIYCSQPHDPIHINEQVVNGTINHLIEKSKVFNRIHFSWFGGEPLLEFESLKKINQAVMEACKENDCIFTCGITTNGYLLNKNMVREMCDLGIKKVQITLDGDKETHDFSRPHKEGKGTFGVILANVLEILKTDIRVTLRINIHEGNINNIESLLKKIPAEVREKVYLSYANWFQALPKLSLYNLYTTAIRLGYKYKHTKNTYVTCERSFDSLISLMPNGKIVMCSEVYDLSESYGELLVDGSINITNELSHYKENTIPSAAERIMCKNCKELPMCMGGCMKARLLNENYCARTVPDGLSLEEKVKTHYLNDLVHGEKGIIHES